MSIFTDVPEIESLVSRLDTLVKRRFREIVRSDAEEIAETLIDEKGLDDVCRDIDEAISEADDLIMQNADSHVIYDFDNFLIGTFDPYPEKEEVDEEVIRMAVCEEREYSPTAKAMQAYAFELWRAGIRNALKEILIEKCKKAGLLRRAASKIVR